ncbi:MAG: Ig-like domain-containing protein [Lachnospiraceae bacterium]|nr:Ig-like domain-containing protein [Lachnospiraceae bacterium]
MRTHSYIRMQIWGIVFVLCSLFLFQENVRAESSITTGTKAVTEAGATAGTDTPATPDTTQVESGQAVDSEELEQIFSDVLKTRTLAETKDKVFLKDGESREYMFHMDSYTRVEIHFTKKSFGTYHILLKNTESTIIDKDDEILFDDLLTNGGKTYTYELEPGDYTFCLTGKDTGKIGDEYMFSYLMTIQATRILDEDHAVYALRYKQGELCVSEILEQTVFALPMEKTPTNIHWSSDHPECAYVGADGIVTALSPGNAMITADLLDEDIQLTFPVVVKQVTINMTEVSLYSGSKATLKLTNNVQWISYISEDEEIATVSDDGVISAQAPGKTTITAQTASDTFTVEVTVLEPKLSAESMILYVEDFGDLQLYGVLTGITWKSTNPKVIAVYPDGEYEALSDGTATIIATANGRSYKCPIKVKRAKPVFTAKMIYNKSKDTKTFSMRITNNGTHPISIYRSGLKTRNTKYKGFERSLRLWNAKRSKLVSRRDIEPGKTATITFQVVGKSIHYNKRTKLYFKIGCNLKKYNYSIGVKSKLKRIS